MSSRGDAASLGQHLDQDDAGHDRLTGEVTLKVEVVWSGEPPGERAFARNDFRNGFQQSHGRLVRESIEPGHRGVVQYTFRPVNVILERFTTICRSDPNRPLVYAPATGRTITTSQIFEASQAYRGVLERLGIRSGAAVLSATGNRPEIASLFLGCWQLGAAVLPVDAGTPLEEIHALARRFGASAIALPEALAAEGAEPRDVTERGLVVKPQDESTWATYSGVGVLKLTSGSTGLPKAVMTGETQLLADTEQITTTMGIGVDDVQLAVIPLSHAYGFGNLLLPLVLRGTPIVLRESFVPQQLLADARTYGARVFHGVPFMFQHFLTQPGDEPWAPTLSLLVSAGARLERDTVQAFHRRFGVKVHSFYGSSESGGITYDGDDDLDDLPTVGRPMPGVTVELRPDPDVPAEYGRVFISGPPVSRAYTGDLNASEGVTLSTDGFFAGDYGYFAPDGRLVLVGRVSTFINVAGRKVQPGEVERVIREMDQVADVRVLAAPDVVRGEQIGAVVATGGKPLTIAEIRAHCARRVAAYKIPRILVLVDEMPLTARGKPDTRALHALIQAHASPSA